MRSSNFFSGNPDLVFTFEHRIPWQRIVPRLEGNFTDPNGPGNVAEAIDLYRQALELLGEYSSREIAERARAVDEAGSAQHGDASLVGPLLRNLEELRDLGAIGLNVPRRLGGENFPFSASAMVLEMLARACASTMVQYAFYMSPAMMLLRFAPAPLQERYVPRLARGEISGSVAMTEPQAGSDVGQVATTARLVDGEWRISGRKQFITNGLGDLCIVLARSEPGSAGLHGLSLFLVERVREESGERVENFTVERAERKICITASVTCGLAFQDARATLLGRRGEGWREILTFMNESRIAVGIQGLGIAQAALDDAEHYAAARVQMGRPIREHPMIADMLLDMRATVAALRALAYEATALYDETEGLRLEIGRLPEGERRRLALERAHQRQSRYLRELTPLVKWMGAEEAIRVCRLAMQIHGGYGVTHDYDVERHLRDSLILPIYEGTSQIQALMATRDLIKAVFARPTVLIGGTPSATLATADTRGELGALYRQALSDFNAAVRALLFNVTRRKSPAGMVGLLRGKRSLEEDDIQEILLHAERLTAMLAYLHAARLLAQGATLHPDRSALAMRAMRRAVVVCATHRQTICQGDRSALEAIQNWRDAR